MDIGKSLLNPTAFPGKVKKVNLIQTHISWVFLTGKYVYKVKKPVNFGFLDFSTLKKRKFYCQKEIELNRRLSPQLYLKILPITSKNGKVKIGGRGKIIEWAVVMRRLPQERIMSSLLKKGKITKDILKRLAKTLADFHQKAEDSKVKKKYKSVKIIKYNWKENFQQTRGFIGKTISKKSYDFIENEVAGFFKGNKKLFQKRIKEEKIKWCHGDLHSGNIFIVGGEIYIFDCIEFNERLTCLDVASDVAFLAMDLDFFNKSRDSDYFIENYLKYSKDLEILKLLNFYKCYRAFVRGKVNSLETADRNITKSERLKAKIKAGQYFNLTLKYAKNI